MVTIWPTVQWVADIIWQGCEADHLAKSTTNVKNGWSYTSHPSCVFMACLGTTLSTGSDYLAIFCDATFKPERNIWFEWRTFYDMPSFCNLTFSAKNMLLRSDLIVRCCNRLN
jgi:hypothetical protein